MNKEKISLILLFYNEESLIEEIVEESRSFLQPHYKEYEILIVAEGNDSTPEIARKLEEKFENVRTLAQTKKRGYGRALKTGIKAANQEYIAYMDGDGQFKINDLEKMEKHIEDSCLVIGNRKNRKDSLFRKTMGTGFRKITYLMLPISFKDPKCGFKLMKKSCIEKINIKRDYAVDTELVTKASEKGMRITEVNLPHYERKNGDSKLDGCLGIPLKTIRNYLKDLYLIRKEIS